MTVHVRLSEYERYDPATDAMVTRLMAITPTGSYWCDIKEDTSSSMRLRKAEFKEETVRLIQNGNPPQEIRLG